MLNEEKPFGRIRSVLFPIYSYELKKLIPLTLIFFCISFNYSVLRSFKDVLMYGNMVDGRKSIYFAKVLVIPSIILLTYLYTFIAKRVNRDVRFNIVAFFFFIFFLLFVLFAYPGKLNEGLKFESFYTFMNGYFPKFSAWWDCIRVWPVTLFYIFVESWGTIMLGVSFWTFANEINSSRQAKRVYSFLMTGAAVGSVFAGAFIKFYERDTFKNLIIPCFLIIILLLIYNYLALKVKNNPEEYEIEVKSAKKKVKLSFIQSIKLLVKSRYLLLLLCVVLGYNVFMVLLESVWKGAINDYKSFLVQHIYVGASNAKQLAEIEVKNIYFLQNILIGCLSLFLIFFFSGNISKKRWRSVAFFTPIVAGVMLVVFVFSYFFVEKIKIFVSLFFSNIQPLYLLVLIGLMIAVFIKSSKYIFFDTSKERAYIPLDDESRVNGKAAIDAIGSRLGKGLSSIFITLCLDPFFSKSTVAAISFAMLFIILSLWIFAIIKLSPEYEAKVLAAGSSNTNKPNLDMNQEVNGSDNKSSFVAADEEAASSDDSSSFKEN